MLLNHLLRSRNINNFGSRFRLYPVQPSYADQLQFIEDDRLEASKMLLNTRWCVYYIIREI